jgi:hypothetical protein
VKIASCLVGATYAGCTCCAPSFPRRAEHWSLRWMLAGERKEVPSAVAKGWRLLRPVVKGGCAAASAGTLWLVRHKARR